MQVRSLCLLSFNFSIESIEPSIELSRLVFCYFICNSLLDQSERLLYYLLLHLITYFLPGVMAA